MERDQIVWLARVVLKEMHNKDITDGLCGNWLGNYYSKIGIYQIIFLELNTSNTYNDNIFLLYLT